MISIYKLTISIQNTFKGENNSKGNYRSEERRERDRTPTRGHSKETPAARRRATEAGGDGGTPGWRSACGAGRVLGLRVGLGWLAAGDTG